MNVAQQLPKNAAVVVMHYQLRDWYCLLLRASGRWCFPDGAIAPRETLWTAARRVAVELTSLDDLEFAWGQVFLDVPSEADGATMRYLAATTMSGDVLLPVDRKLGRARHDGFRWVTFDQARYMLPEPVREVIAWAENTTGLSSVGP